MALISGSDGFLDSMPGICAGCFAAQYRDPHPPFYVCPHKGRLAVQCEGVWELVRLAAQPIAQHDALPVPARTKISRRLSRRRSA